ncbi:hypothetical protein KRR38_15110 [Novosphingobium sp. G106]|uniref:hypothetical protein n=1 Tax=Novosphingobium sp. G106 TaxID=2849500 RepID=UPI001C2D0250|nr:hypothetical protein [Novosphingobium sp. G106]MBV1688964.1 hypothetical protein [Novosphingobium sp. G106]
MSVQLAPMTPTLSVRDMIFLKLFEVGWEQNRIGCRQTHRLDQGTWQRHPGRASHHPVTLKAGLDCVPGGEVEIDQTAAAPDVTVARSQTAAIPFSLWLAWVGSPITSYSFIP